MHKPVNIAIVSRNEIERHGLRSILIEKSFTVVGAYRDHFDLDLDRFATNGVTPLVIIDSSTDEESLETCQYVHEHWPSSKIVIIAAACHGQIVLDAFRAGIDGYVVRQVSVDSLAEMLKLVALGEKMIPSQVFFDLDALQKSGNPEPSNIGIPDANLSDREVEIMQALVRGEANKIIARSMDISEATVKVHVKSILRKLGVMNRTQAAIWGMSRGISGLKDGKNSRAQRQNDRAVNGSPAGYAAQLGARFVIPAAASKTLGECVTAQRSVPPTNGTAWHEEL